MSASLWMDGSHVRSIADIVLETAARFWFAVTVAGQLIFAAYVVGFYGGSAARGDLESWNRVMPQGHVSGDPIGNLVVAIHLFLAVIIIVGGPLQFIPSLRAWAPSFHHWNGRVYIIGVVATSLAALYMIWVRGAGGDIGQHIGGSLDAVLILIFAMLAVRNAIAGDLSAHRRWALRLFIAVSASYFFRVGLMLWVMLNDGPVGFDLESFTGPALTFLAFANSLVPLLILELYLRTNEGADAGGRLAMATALVVLTVLMGVGISAAARFMWLPHM